MASKLAKNGLNYLIRDHRKVDTLFTQFFSTANAVQRRGVVDQIVKELSGHAAVEEQILYPIVRYNIKDNGPRWADRSIHEHQEVKNRLQELEKMHETDPQYESKVKELKSVLQTHIDEEENQIFPKLREVLTDNDLSDMEDVMDTAKKMAPTHPHPMAPNAPPGNLFAGPLAGAWDRLKDMITGRKA